MKIVFLYKPGGNQVGKGIIYKKLKLTFQEEYNMQNIWNFHSHTVQTSLKI